MIGGPDRDRTDDLFHAMEARSQLRHRPTMANLLILVDPPWFVKPRPRARCSHRGDLKANCAAGQWDLWVLTCDEVTEE